MNDDHSDDAPAEEPADSSRRLPEEARRVLTRILSQRFITRTRAHDDEWAALLAWRPEITDRLADLYFQLHIDPEAGVAFKRHTREEGAPRSLLRQERPLSRDASFLLLMLRQEAELSDPDDDRRVVSRTQFEEFLRAYREDEGQDEARFAARVTSAAKELDEFGLIHPDKDADYLYLVSPALVPLVGLEEIEGLRAAYERGLRAAEPDSLATVAATHAGQAAEDGREDPRGMAAADHQEDADKEDQE